MSSDGGGAVGKRAIRLVDSDILEKKAILINANNTITNVEVLGIFQTHIPLYDEHFVLSTIQKSSA